MGEAVIVICQSRDITQLFDKVWQNLGIFSPFRCPALELRTRPSI